MKNVKIGAVPPASTRAQSPVMLSVMSHSRSAYHFTVGTSVGSMVGSFVGASVGASAGTSESVPESASVGAADRALWITDAEFDDNGSRLVDAVSRYDTFMTVENQIHRLAT